MSAPCAGFVWFRWFRPRTWHDYQPHVLVMKYPACNVIEAVVVPKAKFDSYVKQLPLDPTQPYVCWRPTTDYCSACGKSALFKRSR